MEGREETQTESTGWTPSKEKTIKAWVVRTLHPVLRAKQCPR